MSRTAEDWTKVRMRAVNMRDMIHDIMEDLDDWPVEFSDSDRQAGPLKMLGFHLNDAVRDFDQLIGSLTVKWVESDRTERALLMEDALKDNDIFCSCGEIGYCEAGPQCGSGG